MAFLLFDPSVQLSYFNGSLARVHWDLGTHVIRTFSADIHLGSSQTPDMVAFIFWSKEPSSSWSVLKLQLFIHSFDKSGCSSLAQCIYVFLTDSDQHHPQRPRHRYATAPDQVTRAPFVLLLMLFWMTFSIALGWVIYHAGVSSIQSTVIIFPFL